MASCYIHLSCALCCLEQAADPPPQHATTPTRMYSQKMNGWTETMFSQLHYFYFPMMGAGYRSYQFREAHVVTMTIFLPWILHNTVII